MGNNTGIVIVNVEPNIQGGRSLVARTRQTGMKCPYVKLNMHISWEVFKALPVPIMLLSWVDGVPVAHSEIRDLGSVGGYRIAGLADTTVAEGYRHRGIYKRVIALKNILIDMSDFDCTVSRVKKGHEDHYMSLYPGYEVLLPKGPWEAVWCIRVTRPFDNANARVREYLLENKIRW